MLPCLGFEGCSSLSLSLDQAQLQSRQLQRIYIAGSKLVLQITLINKESEGETKKTTNKDMSYIYQEQKVQPCHLSSSIYYGGQDIYSHPSSTRDSGLNNTYKKDDGEDDSGSASRGNWWQGSLYY
ncbi:hypothetical protein P8452_53236 [Trifolium repens]|nr:hypothetical protein P8452_53236 [Trifolium repens]